MRRKNRLFFASALVSALAAGWPLLAGGSLSKTQAGKCRRAILSASLDLKAPEEFAEAMTKGMRLRPEHRHLFELYSKNWFGPYPSEQTLDNALEVINRHPKLSKLPAREQILVLPVKLRGRPESLERFLRSFQKSAGSIRNNMFQMAANWGFWAKMLAFPEPETPAGLTKKEIYKQEFFNYLRGLIGKDAIQLAGGGPQTGGNYREKTKALYRALEKAKRQMEKRGLDTRQLAGAMADLVHAAGFGNPFYMELLKSGNPEENMSGINYILTERDSIAFELGFERHFEGLKAALDARQAADWTGPLTGIQKDIESQPYISQGSEIFRVRPLSLQESPFRSCLSGDCASGSYFEKALDPDFLFFTLTDMSHKSSGYAAVVLGTAKTRGRRAVKTAFVDKLQNIPSGRLIPFLEAVRRSLREQGFRLGLPKNTGRENGLSNDEKTRSYVRSKILPFLEGGELNEFQPRGGGLSHHFNGEGYSRANQRLDMLEFQGIEAGIIPDRERPSIEPGGIFPPKTAPKSLSLKELYQPIIALRDSPRAEDQAVYMDNLISISGIEGLGVSEDAAKGHLTSIIKDQDRPFYLRKQAFFTLSELYAQSEPAALSEFSSCFVSHEYFLFLETWLAQFAENERKTLTGELSNWKNARSIWRQTFVKTLNRVLFGDIKDIKLAQKSDLKMRLLDVNITNTEDDTPLMAAAYEYWNHEKMEFLLGYGADPNILNEAGEAVLTQLAERLAGLREERFHFERDILIKEMDIIEKMHLLLEYGGDPNIQDANGETALMIISSTTEVGEYGMERMLDRGANINMQNNKGETALMKAAAAADTGKIEFLIKNGASMDIQDERGETAETKLIKSDYARDDYDENEKGRLSLIKFIFEDSLDQLYQTARMEYY